MPRHIFAVILLLAFCAAAQSQFVEIPDLYLRRAIQHTLKLGFDDPVTEADMRRLTRLHAEHMQIIDLSGLEHAVNLTSLRLNRNGIVDISPLKNLSRLRELDLSQCSSLKNLHPLSNLVDLSVLGLWDCDIEDISALANLTRLTELNLVQNRIRDIGPLADLTQLRTLYLSYNYTGDIRPLAKLTQLRQLHLANFGIDNVNPLAGLTSLTELYLNGNSIVDIRPLQDLANLRILDLSYNRVADISPLENLTNLTKLVLGANRIRDIRPLGNLTKLLELELIGGAIRDISALANLTKLTKLDLRASVEDVSPLASLTQLTELVLENNRIEDVSPLANLTNLEELAIRFNPILDYSPLEALSIGRFLYTPPCAEPRPPLSDRINNRDFPSIILPWPYLYDSGPQEHLALHDLQFSGEAFGLHYAHGPTTATVGGYIEGAVMQRNKIRSVNPNLIYLISVPMIGLSYRELRYDSPHYILDERGWFQETADGFLVDFVQPEVQDIIVQRALSIYRCGLYDGIVFDYGRDYVQNYEGYWSEQAIIGTRENILRRIRSEVGDEFLILANGSWQNVPRIEDYVNGLYLELKVGGEDGKQDSNGTKRTLITMENRLLWAQRNLKAPQIICLEGWSFPGEYSWSETNVRWMRAMTALSLTHSDGFMKFGTGARALSGADWYEFWNVDLGRPVGEMAQRYDNRPGLFIREFTNGWAVYNRSGETQLIRLPEDVRSKSAGVQAAEHQLPNFDGEIFLRIKRQTPADVNNDGEVNVLDLIQVAQGFGTDIPGLDLNGDGQVNILDLVAVAGELRIEDEGD
ncbi:MAG: leucine-rich repeat domain-containing protein [Candidatus Poribacteria bacterium]|nr:leucine-rich repeat domain-containing protein [Candidatus Poribacteria bacterium]